MNLSSFEVRNNTVRIDSLLHTMYSTVICPPSIEIKKRENGYYIVSLKDFCKGDTIFENTSILFNTNTIKNIIVSIEGNYVICLDFLVHTVNRDNNIREYYGFDTFTNHSCDPNCSVELPNEEQNSLITYSVIARKNIKIGDELTQDYTTFDSMLDNTEFVCQCNSIDCKKIIRG